MLASRNDLPLWILQTFRSLRSEDYRTYALSQLISNCGTWIQLTVISWLVLDLTGSPFMLGLVNFLRLAPVAFLGFLGGILADRLDRKRILICTKILMFLQATLLGVLTISGVLQTWHVLLLAFLLGISNAIDLPAKQSKQHRQSNLVHHGRGNQKGEGDAQRNAALHKANKQRHGRTRAKRCQHT